ncbi:MAG: hypothetical protein IKS03_00260 [Ruminococcus sp.]|nr:hypothetical protein [Ruminococcus sp.]
MKRRKEIPVPEKKREEYICPSASWGDMTGLIPNNPEKKDSEESYRDVYPYMPEYRGE